MNPTEQTQLRDLLTQGRVLALAVLVEGLPTAGLLPFAAPPDLSHLLILASGLAAHTRGLSDGAPYSALIHQPDRPSLDPHQVPRVTLRGTAQRLPRDAPPYAAARITYLGKFPASEMLFGLGDFNLYALQIEAARYVAGFGRAFTLSTARLREIVGGG
jgi:putative heme iron utilization protein